MPRIEFLDCPFDAVTEDEAVAQCLAWRDDSPRRTRMLVTPNAAVLMMMRGDSELREACRAGDLVVADGVPVVWATRLLRTPLPERINGCDLMARLLREGAAHGLRVFFLGAKEEVVTTLVERVRREHPGLVVAGWRNGYFSKAQRGEVLRQVRDARADVLFVGMGTPFKEVWCHRHRDELDTPVIIPVGGSFDVLAGFVRRAPRWMQRCGLEWFWRLLMEPRRMWKRYLVTNAQFLALVARELCTSGRRPSIRQTGSRKATHPTSAGRTAGRGIRAP